MKGRLEERRRPTRGITRLKIKARHNVSGEKYPCWVVCRSGCGLSVVLTRDYVNASAIELVDHSPLTVLVRCHVSQECVMDEQTVSTYSLTFISWEMMRSSWQLSN